MQYSCTKCGGKVNPEIETECKSCRAPVVKKQFTNRMEISDDPYLIYPTSVYVLVKLHTAVRAHIIAIAIWGIVEAFVGLSLLNSQEITFINSEIALEHGSIYLGIAMVTYILAKLSIEQLLDNHSNLMTIVLGGFYLAATPIFGFTQRDIFPVIVGVLFLYLAILDPEVKKYLRYKKENPEK